MMPSCTIEVTKLPFPKVSSYIWVAMQATGQPPKYHILQYKYVPDILEKREPHRKGHLDAIKDAVGSH